MIAGLCSVMGCSGAKSSSHHGVQEPESGAGGGKKGEEKRRGEEGTGWEGRGEGRMLAPWLPSYILPMVLPTFKPNLLPYLFFHWLILLGNFSQTPRGTPGWSPRYPPSQS